MTHAVEAMVRGMWGGTGAWLGVTLCLLALLYQSIHLESLQRELAGIQKSRDASRLQVRKSCDMPLCPRHKRELPNIRKKRHHGNRALLHLVPESLSSNDAADITKISWKVSLHEGKSLEVHGKNVRVRHSGIYSIYSQVFYKDNTFTMGHLVIRKSDGETAESEILLRCIQSMPDNEKLAYNTCYTSGVFKLRKGNVITLEIPRRNATLDTNSHATFLGFIRL